MTLRHLGLTFDEMLCAFVAFTTALALAFVVLAALLFGVMMAGAPGL